jgi:hypothetical protein
VKKSLKKFVASRPIAVHYPGGHVGHCKTLRNALVAATRRMLVDEVDDKATVYYQDEVIADIVRSGHRLQVMWRVKWAAQGSDLW